MDNIQNLLKKYGDEVFGDRYYEVPKIPEKKLRKAIKKFNYNGKKEYIIMFYDNKKRLPSSF